MTAKEYLGQAYRIDQRINSKLEQVTTLREASKKATATLSPSPRSASPDLHSMESILVKIFDLEREINGDIDTLVDLKREIMCAIKRVENPEYQLVLEQRFLCFKRWEQIAVDLGYTTRHLFRVMDEALECVRVPDCSVQCVDGAGFHTKTKRCQ